MRPLLRVMGHVSTEHPIQMPAPADQDVVQAFRANGPYEPLGEEDPDGVTRGAEFVPIGEAVERLSSSPWGLSEPIVADCVERRPSASGCTDGGAGPWDGKGPAQLVLGPETR